MCFLRVYGIKISHFFLQKNKFIFFISRRSGVLSIVLEYLQIFLNNLILPISTYIIHRSYMNNVHSRKKKIVQHVHISAGNTSILHSMWKIEKRKNIYAIKGNILFKFFTISNQFESVYFESYGRNIIKFKYSIFQHVN